MSSINPSREEIERAKQVKAIVETRAWTILMARLHETEEPYLTDLMDTKKGFDQVQVARGFLQYPKVIGAVVTEFMRIADTSLDEPAEEDEIVYR